MEKKIIIRAELTTQEKKKESVRMFDNIIVIPEARGYRFCYYDGDELNELSIKMVRVIEVEALVFQPEKKKKLLLERDRKTN